MKILMLNGSCNPGGAMKAGLDEMAEVFAAARAAGVPPPQTETGNMTNFVR